MPTRIIDKSLLELEYTSGRFVAHARAPPGLITIGAIDRSRIAVRASKSLIRQRIVAFGGFTGAMVGMGLLAPSIVGADRHLPFSDKGLSRRVLAHLVLSLFFTTAFIYLAGAIHAPIGLGVWEVLLNPRPLRNAAAIFYYIKWDPI